MKKEKMTPNGKPQAKPLNDGDLKKVSGGYSQNQIADKLKGTSKTTGDF